MPLWSWLVPVSSLALLALAVTAIETALILSMMIAGGEEMAALPRDAIYATVMIICTGVVGICVLVGGLAHRGRRFASRVLEPGSPR
jgi:Ca2+:H+ antiporter